MEVMHMKKVPFDAPSQFNIDIITDEKNGKGWLHFKDKSFIPVFGLHLMMNLKRHWMNAKKTNLMNQTLFSIILAY